MTFEIGEVVEPQTTIVFSGTEYDLTGTSGTVTDREQTSVDSEGDPSYIYLVNLFEPLVVGSGNAQQSNSNFWLTEDQITGESTGFTADLTTLQVNVGAAQGDVASANSSIDQILSNIPTTNPYYSLINQYKVTVTGSESRITETEVDSSLNETAIGRDANTQNRNATNSSTDALIAKELAENLYGIYSVTSEIESELSESAAQAKIQEELAAADDAENFNVFYNTYVNTDEGKGLLSPSSSELSQETTQDFTELNDESDVNPDMLIGGTLDLEQD